MTLPPLTCEETEVALERRLHGALHPEEEPALAAHLSGCPACRAYERTGRDAEVAMRAVAAEAVRGMDWERVRAGVRRGQRGYWLEQWVAPVVAVLAFVPLAVRGSPPWVWLMVAGVTLPLCARMFSQARARLRVAHEAARTDLAALAWMREEADQRLRSRRLLLTLDAALPALVCGTLLFGQGPAAGWARAGLLLLVVALAVDSAWGLWVELPRLQRERAELE